MSVTFVIITIISICSLIAWQKQHLVEKLSFHPYSVEEKNEYYRFLSCALVHGGYTHLFFNMFSLYIFGKYVENYFILLFGENSTLFFVLLFCTAVIVSNIPSYMKYKHASYYYSLGASGGVSAIVFASIFLEPLQKLIFIFLPIPVPGFIIGVLYLFYSYYQSKNAKDNIDHSAHLVGALFGIAFLIFLEKSLIYSFWEKISSWSLF